jgi:hypothetical protein
VIFKVNVHDGTGIDALHDAGNLVVELTVNVKVAKSKLKYVESIVLPSALFTT